MKTLIIALVLFCCALATNAQTPSLVWTQEYPPSEGNHLDPNELQVWNGGLFLGGYTNFKSHVIRCNSVNGLTQWVKLDTTFNNNSIASHSQLNVLAGKNKTVNVSHQAANNNYRLVFRDASSGALLNTSSVYVGAPFLAVYGDSVVVVDVLNDIIFIYDEFGTQRSSFPIGANITAGRHPKVVGDKLTIFTTSFNGTYRNTVMRFDLATRQQTWRKDFMDSIGITTDGDVDSSGNCYVGMTVTGSLNPLYALWFRLCKLNGTNGAIIWDTMWLPNGSSAANEENFVQGVSISQYQNLILIGAQIRRDSLQWTSQKAGYLAAFDLDGHRKWSTRIVQHPQYVLNHVQGVKFHQGYFYALGKSFDNGQNPLSIGWIKKYAPDSMTGIQNQNEIAEKFSLSQNYPNPFNPVTKIQFSVPKKGLVNLTVYDILGREVEILVNGMKPAGNYEVSFDGVNLPSGVYFYRLKTDDFTDTKKMILMK